MKWQTVRFTVVVLLIAVVISGLFLLEVESDARARVIVLTSQAQRIADIQGTLTAAAP